MKININKLKRKQFGFYAIQNFQNFRLRRRKWRFWLENLRNFSKFLPPAVK